MGDLLELMAAPFAACVVLVGIHAYLGMHVIQRKVIFVDLALAQIAALGATFSFLLGLSPHGRGGYVFALGFGIAGAAIFSLTRMRHERIPQEAIIGIVYVVALATAILVADRAPEGAEHIKETLVGSILWVHPRTIYKTAIIYALVGALHVALRKRFLQISFHPEQAYAEKRWVRFWDFVFYVTFAFVITSSVAIAGVLLVFTFLVIPAVIATLFATRISSRLALGWSVGIVACLIGMVASYRFDMPSGPTVVSSLGVALILAALLYYVVSAEKKTGAILKVAAGIAIVIGGLAGLGIFFSSGTFMHIAHEHDWEREHDPTAHAPGEDSGAWAAIRHDCAGDPACTASHIGEHPDWPIHLSNALGSEDVSEREAAVDVLARLDDPRGLDLLAEAALSERDGLLRSKEASLLVEGGDGRGLSVAVRLLEEDFPPLIRDEAHQLLLEHSGQDFGYDPFASGADNADAVARWNEWARSRTDTPLRP
jgi:zinc/manganese transport system permease protein